MIRWIIKGRLTQL